MKRFVVALVFLVTASGIAGGAAVAAAADAGSPNATVAESSLELEPAADQQICGAVDAGAEADVNVKLRVPAQFVQSTSATVGEDGNFVATADFSDLDPGTTVNGKVLVDGETATEFEIAIVESDDAEGCPEPSDGQTGSDDGDDGEDGTTDDGDGDGTADGDGDAADEEDTDDSESTNDATAESDADGTDETDEQSSEDDQTSDGTDSEDDGQSSDTSDENAASDEGDEANSSSDGLPGFGVAPALLALLAVGALGRSSDS